MSEPRRLLIALDVARRVGFALAVIAFIGSLAFSYYLTSIYVTFPQVPDAKTQHVVPYDVKGTTVYVTQNQMTEIKVVRTVQIASGIIFFALIASFRFYRIRQES